MYKRSFLLGVLNFFIINGCIFAQADYIGNSFQPPPHPRILLFRGEESILKNKANGNAVWGKIQQTILNESDNIITTAPIQRIQIGRRLLDKSREALRRIFFLSYAYRTSGDKKYAERGERELLTIAAFSDWNPSHFLDVAEMTMATAIGYDWLHDYLSPASRAAIQEAILEKGLEPSLDSKYNSWLKAEHNWNQVCNAGMTYGALAIYEEQPQLAKQIINRAIESITLPMKDYAPDGGYPEGYGYWGYGTSFNIMFISAVEKIFEKNFGLSQRPGFLHTASFLENMTGTTGKPFNYSDAGATGGLHPAMFWFAAKTKDPSLLWVEKNYLNENPPKYINDRLLPAIMIWGLDVDLSKIAPPKSTMWTGQGKNPVALMRTSWTDTNAIYTAMKGGSVSVNHAHMDIGSFVMDADGVRWAMDFGMQDYESLESKGIQLFGRTQDAQRWTVFRYTNLVHNTLAINNQHQKVTGYAPILSSGTNPLFMNAVVDLTEVYKGSIAKATRGIAIVNKSYVVVRDEIETLDSAVTIRWTMLTPATVKITATDKAELKQKDKKLILQVDAPSNIVMKTWSTDPPNSYDAPNPGTALVGFEMTIPGHTKAEWNVKLIPEKALNQTSGKIQPLKKWK